MAKRFAIRMQNDGVASAITDDRVVTSVQNELLSLVFLNEVFDRLANPFGAAPWLFCLHSLLLFCAGYGLCFLGTWVFEKQRRIGEWLKYWLGLGTICGGGRSSINRLPGMR
jgi:hypothetical protein